MSQEEVIYILLIEVNILVLKIPMTSLYENSLVLEIGGSQLFSISNGLTR